MRISDWSSDVCSSDLATLAGRVGQAGQEGRGIPHRQGEWGRCTQTRSQDGTQGREQVQASGCKEDGAQEQQEGNRQARPQRSEEHTSELQSLMRISYAVFCLKKKKKTHNNRQQT